MARSGRFGHLPRTAPNLGSVMISLAREMAAQRDRNIVDAWQNGGEVDGKKVTDEDLLAHFTDRRDHVSKDDPLWVYYDNLLKTYTFRIEDSKMTVRYAQGSVSDMEMAAWYESQAALQPADSEIARDLLRTAAQYRDRARQVSEAGAARAKAQRYQDSFDQIDAQYHRPYATAEMVVTEVARQLGILQGSETLDDLRSSGPGLREEDFGRLETMFSDMWTSTDPQIIQMREYLTANGMGGLTYDQFSAMSQNTVTGWHQKADLARANGDFDNAAKFDQKAFDAQDVAWFIADADEWTKYDDLRTAWESKIADPTLAPWEIERINAQYADALHQLGGETASGQLGGAINNEILALNGEASGGSPVEGGTGAMSDNSETATNVARNRAEMAGVADGSMVWTQVTDANGNRVWTVVANGPRDPKTGITVMARVAGQTVPVWIPFTTVYSDGWSQPDPRTGSATGTLDQKPGQDPGIGKTYTSPSGQQMWGIFDDNGQLQWFDHPPFSVATGYSWATDDKGDVHVNWVPPDAPTASQTDQTGGTYDVWGVVDNGQMTAPDIAGRTLGSATSTWESFYTQTPEGRMAIQTLSEKQLADMLAVQGLDEGTAAEIIRLAPQWREEGRAQANQEAQALARAEMNAHGVVGAGLRAVGMVSGGDEIYGAQPAGANPQATAANLAIQKSGLMSEATGLLQAAGIGAGPSYLARLGALSPEQLTSWIAEMRRRAAVMAVPPPLGRFGYFGMTQAQIDQRQRDLREQARLREQGTAWGQANTQPGAAYSWMTGQFTETGGTTPSAPYAPPPIPSLGPGGPGGGSIIKIPSPPPVAPYKPPPPPGSGVEGGLGYTPPPLNIPTPPSLPTTPSGTPIRRHTQQY